MKDYKPVIKLIKTMRKSFLLAALFIILISTVEAQDGFRVLATKGGAVMYPSANNQNKSNLKSGKTIPANYMIEVPKGAYVGLVYKNGKTIEIKNEGTYKTSELITNVNKGKSSASERYADFVYSELSKSGGSKGMSNNHRQYMSVTGSVERAITRPGAINPIAPIKSDVMPEGTLTLFWEPKEGAEQYKVSITNLFEEEIFSKTTTDNSAKIDLDQLADQKNLLYTVEVVGDPSSKSDIHNLRIADPNKQKEVQKIRAELSDAESPLGKVVSAAVYEQNNMYVNAVEAYKEAMKMAPDVEDYQTLYDDYLVRNHSLQKTTSHQYI